MRSLILTGFAVLAFGAATSAWANGPIAGGASLGMDKHFQLDAQGRCHDAHGALVPTGRCKAPPKQCRDPKNGRVIKCPVEMRKAGGAQEG